MTRKIMIVFLTLFQDKFVQIGTVIGAIAGLLSPELIGGDAFQYTIIFGFIGWGMGAYLGHFLTGPTYFAKKKKFRVFQGGR